MPPSGRGSLTVDGHTITLSWSRRVRAFFRIEVDAKTAAVGVAPTSTAFTALAQRAASASGLPWQTVLSACGTIAERARDAARASSC